MSCIMDKKQIIKGFLQEEVGHFELGETYKCVKLHKQFNVYIKLYPEDSIHKYGIMFGTKTKSIFKEYLEKDIGLEYNSRNAGYFINYNPNYCETVNNNLWS